MAACLPGWPVQVLKTWFELWFWDSKPNLVRRLMRLLLTRQLVESLHPCGETYGQVGGQSTAVGCAWHLYQDCERHSKVCRCAAAG